MKINTPAHYEIKTDSSTTLRAKYGAKVKSAGGSYREARGYTTERFWFVPTTAPKLAEALIREGGDRVVVILRGVLEGRHSSTMIFYGKVLAETKNPVQFMLRETKREIGPSLRAEHRSRTEERRAAAERRQEQQVSEGRRMAEVLACDGADGLLPGEVVALRAEVARLQEEVAQLKNP